MTNQRHLRLASPERVIEETKPSRQHSRVIWTAVILLVLIGVGAAVRRALFLVPIMINGYVEPAPSPNPMLAQFRALDDLFARYPVLTLVHIIPALMFLILAPVQFSRRFRERHIKWHRRNGRLVLMCGMVVGLSALVMSLGMPAIGGVNQAAATTLFALFFLFALGRAYRHIRRREITLHREWMIRAFSIGLAVATIRPIIGFFFATGRLTGLTPYEFFGTAFWMGFVLHLITAEIWIKWTKPKISVLPFRVLP